jgi:DNA-binding LacI/PurR family transcriptional regulator
MRNTKQITLKEIAARAETSTMAVSVVLNGARSNTRVSEATRRRILTVAAGLNYTPNAMARGLRRQRTNTLGVLFNWAGSTMIHSLYSVAVLDGIVAGAATAGYHILLYTESWRSTTQSASTFADQRTDGVVVIAPQEDSDVVSGLVGLGVPVVLLSSATTVPGVPYVTVDNQVGIEQALDHLRDLGHTRIAYVGTGTGRHSTRVRYEAYRNWMARHDLPTPDADRLGNLVIDQEEESLNQLLAGEDRPTAILAYNDDMAMIVLEVARERGLSVPGDLSVVGYDDTLAASLTAPKLTSVRQPLIEMGQQAAKLLVREIESRQTGPSAEANPDPEPVSSVPQAHVAVPELVVRESTGPV